MDYFDKNWLPKKHLWATSSMVEVVHFGNTTNNRLENANRQIKTMVRKSNTIEVVLNNLFLYTERHHVEKTSELSVSMRRKKRYAVDSSLQDVLNEFTPFAADLIAQDVLRLGSLSVSNAST